MTSPPPDRKSWSALEPHRSALFALGGALVLLVLLLTLHECTGDARPEVPPGGTQPGKATEGQAPSQAPSQAPNHPPRAELEPMFDPVVAQKKRNTILRGRIFDGRGNPAADQPYWVHWGQQIVDGTRDIAVLSRAPANARRTDSLGRFTVDLKPERRGLLWFHGHAGLRAACVLNPETLETRQWKNVRLPRCETVTIRGSGVPQGSRFRAFVSPAARTKGGWNASEVELWPARFWRRADNEVDFLVTHSFATPEYLGTGTVRVLAWRPYEFDVHGEDFDVKPQPDRERVVRAPGTRTFSAKGPTPTGLVAVRDPNGGTKTAMAGCVITGPMPGAGRWRERRWLEGGRCRLGYQMLRAGETARLWVVMADGELFESKVDVSRSGPTPMLTFLRGTGQLPKKFPSALGARIGRPRVFAEIASGQLREGVTWDAMDFADGSKAFSYVDGEEHVSLLRAPADLTRLLLMYEDGRVAAGTERLEWLPADAVPEVDLADAYRRFGKQDRAQAEFDIQVVTGSGHPRWITLDRFAMGPKTTWFPKWRKSVPSGMKFRFAFAIDGEAPVQLEPGQSPR